MSKEILVVFNRKLGAVKAQLTQIKDFINNPDEKNKTKLESKLDTLKSLRIKLSDIQNEFYEVVEYDRKMIELGCLVEVVKTIKWNVNLTNFNKQNGS
ncbi:hypothetical protein TNCT_271781 [Trichonephila clavata]|uniref:Uncharacterized protein n=1 Tax=Trichonephila clavata TaxID=2740835 RepID=A0A8X6FD83_TRICU|nr:hypothetical protein TNCT_271781 [Trichonephila clavata]